MWFIVWHTYGYLSLQHMASLIVLIIDAACDAVNVFIVWNILCTDNDVRYVRMYAHMARTIDNPRMQHMNEHMNDCSYVWI